MDWPAEVVDMIARRRCVVFLGSGISNNCIAADGSRPPTWGGFLDHAIQQCPAPRKHIKTYLNAGDYLSACDIIRDRMGDQWNGYLRNRFVDPGFNPVEIHKNIFNLDARVYITPNFDKIFDRHALEASGGTVSIKSYAEEDVSEVAKGTGRYILKIHGDIDIPHRLIFTRRQYAEARTKYPSAYKVLEALLVTSCFLFIGCGLNDPDLNLLLEDYRFLHSYASGHYVVLPKKVHGDSIRLLKDTRNLRVLEYDKKDNHKLLTDSIARLAELADARRVEIARNASW